MRAIVQLGAFLGTVFLAAVVGGLGGWIVENARTHARAGIAVAPPIASPTFASSFESLLDRASDALERGDPVALRRRVARARRMLWTARVHGVALPDAQGLRALVRRYDRPLTVLELASDGAIALAAALPRAGADPVAWARVTSALPRVRPPSPAAEPPAPAPRTPEPSVHPPSAPTIPGVVFAKLPAGSYAVGDARRRDGQPVPALVRHVALPIDHFVATTEITQAVYARETGSRPWTSEEASWHGEALPAHSVSHEEAMAFCRLLTERYGGGVWTFSLPDDDVWEVAARAGTPADASAFGFSDPHRTVQDQADLGRLIARYSVYRSPKDARDARRPAPVASRLANPLGLHDVHGNVAEWVMRTDGVEAEGAMPARGGSLYSDPWDTRAASRQLVVGASPVVGFRVVATRTR